MIAAVAEPEQKVQAAVLLALMVGAIQLGITLLRLGDLTRYISHSVIVGFTAGAGTLLVLDQMKNLFGLHAMGDAHDHFLVRFWRTLTEGGGIHAATAAIGLGTIALVLALRCAQGPARPAPAARAAARRDRDGRARRPGSTSTRAA